MDASAPPSPAAEAEAVPAGLRRRFILRLAVGLAQGLALLVLYLAASGQRWPFTQPALFAPLTLVCALVPVVVLGGIGRLRPFSLVIWTAVAAGLVALIGWHDAAAGQPEPFERGPLVFVVSAVFLFIAHHLVLPADRAGRLIAPYGDYFDTAWKAAVQLGLSVGFTAVFWLVLWLGAGLFGVIGLDFLSELLRQSWCYIPLTTLAFALAVHLTDVRDGLIRGVRTVALMLLSWLLPVMAVLALGFLLALPFTGLEPLWNTGAATALLLAAAAALIVLINAVYQDGHPDEAVHPALAIAARAAGLALVPLIALALWGLALRIGQHGLTPERVFASACAALGAVYALGYGLAAVRPGAWMRPLEVTNVIAGTAAVGLILALFTPLADPSRLSVADQLARLERGTVSAEEFDYAFLRFDTGRWGRAALDRLAASSDPEIARRAREAQALTVRPPIDAEVVRTPTYERAEGSGPLPPSFIQPVETFDPRAGCNDRDPCVASARDWTGDGRIDVLIANAWQLQLFVLPETGGGWRAVATYRPSECGASVDARDLLREGQVTPAPSSLPALSLDGELRNAAPENPCEYGQ